MSQSTHALLLMLVKKEDLERFTIVAESFVAAKLIKPREITCPEYSMLTTSMSSLVWDKIEKDHKKQ